MDTNWKNNDTTLNIKFRHIYLNKIQTTHMNVTKNPFDKFTENCFDTLCFFCFSHIRLGWEKVEEGSRMYNKIRNCTEIF